MDINSVPTKGNLIAAKHTLALAKQGYELMDKKRTILIKEIMSLTDKANEIRDKLCALQDSAYNALQKAVTQLGHKSVESIGWSVEEEKGISLKSRSVMGAQLPVAILERKEIELALLSVSGTSEVLDEAYIKFNEIKELLVRLATIENTLYRLTINVKKTAKRANALENITIPKYEERIKSIQGTLEERGRDEFMRSKMVKKG